MRYLHVAISTKMSPHTFEFLFDQDIESIRRVILSPYYFGRPIAINGKTLPQEEIDRIWISETQQSANEMWPVAKGNLEAEMAQMRDGDDSLASMMARRYPSLMKVTEQQIAIAIMKAGENVSNDLLVSDPDVGSALPGFDSSIPRLDADLKNVFLVHGRNDVAREAMFTFLRSIGLHPIEWSEAIRATGIPNPYVAQVLESAFSKASAVVVLFSPDDEARLKDVFHRPDDPRHETNLWGQARPNVLFEAGMAMGRSEKRTILVELGNLRPFSDLAGRHVVRINDSTERRQELVQRLEAAGCPVNRDGTDWHTAGDFAAAAESPGSTVEEWFESKELEIPADARRLLLSAARTRDNAILMITTQGGSILRSGGDHFGELGDRRSQARWGAALGALIEAQLVEDATGKGKLFQVTHAGFEVADGLSRNE